MNLIVALMLTLFCLLNAGLKGHLKSDALQTPSYFCDHENSEEETKLKLPLLSFVIALTLPLNAFFCFIISSFRYITSIVTSVITSKNFSRGPPVLA